jgi:general secretion pathway protein D
MLGGGSRFRVVRGGWAAVFVCVAAAGVGACNLLSGEDGKRGPDVFDKVRAIDLLPRFPQQTGTTTTGPTEGSRPVTYEGTLEGAPPGTVQPTANGEGFELNFENTPVTTVAKVILGDILQTGYTIDPRVQGTVSLASGRPVPKGDLLFVLESALRMSNVVLVREGRGYKIAPAGDAVGTGNIDLAGRAEAGFGVTVVPLRYVSAATLVKVLDGFAVKQGTVRVEPGRNLVLIQGSGTERRSATETVMSFDADWMRGQSVGIYPVRNSTPEPIITELERIMDLGEGGMSQSLVKLQPVGRLNAIMVVTSRPNLLRTAAMWISRLDKSDTTSTGVRVYRVRYGDAKQMAALLNDVFGGGRATTSGLDTSTNQIVPGAGVVQLSTGDRNAPTTSGLNIPGARVQPGASDTRSPTGGAPATGAATFGDRFASPGRTPGNTTTTTTSTFTGGPAGNAVLPNVRITADAVNNTLLIYANQESYRLIEQTLRQIDRPQLQVSIDATIAEITLNDNLNYGVQFFLKSKDLGLGDDKGSGVLSRTASQILSRPLPGFNFLIGPELEPRLIIDALRTVSDVKVLSTPSVVVLDNQVATLQVGDQVPVATASATVLTGTGAPVVNTIDYRNTGVILRVVPRINSNGNVLLDVEQEISNVAPGSAGSLTPTVSQRKIKSSIAVASGQTVLLAGLISETQNNTRSGIPLVDQLGELGKLIGNTSKVQARTELIIFIRPQIIRDGVDAMRIAEELRTKLKGRLGVVEPGSRQR